MEKRKPVSAESIAKYDADTTLAGRFGDLLERARTAEQVLRAAQADGAGDEELHWAGQNLDDALTAVMRAAYAAQRREIGPRGYEDRIYRRKALAKPPVRAWTMEAERLLTLRESHRLTGIVRLPRAPQPGQGDDPGGYQPAQPYPSAPYPSASIR